jgi:hypothetical protein
LLVRWRGSMEWSNSERNPTKNWINHGRLGGASHNQLGIRLFCSAGILFCYFLFCEFWLFLPGRTHERII